MIIFIIFFTSLVSSFFLPWWSACFISFLAAFFLGKSNKQAFWAGFLGLTITWVILIFFKSIPNDYILASRVSKLFHLPHWLVLVLITLLIGGIAGGLSALSGFLTRRCLTYSKNT